MAEWADTGAGTNGAAPKVVVTVEIFEWEPGMTRLMWRPDSATAADPNYNPRAVLETLVRESTRALNSL